jgi:hypothetical protein
MENKEIKTESSMQERFDKEFGQKCLGETLGHDEVHQKQLKSFIQSEIDRAVAKREKEIMDIINNS